jgi:hypothetical protein
MDAVKSAEIVLYISCYVRAIFVVLEASAAELSPTNMYRPKHMSRDREFDDFNSLSDGNLYNPTVVGHTDAVKISEFFGWLQLYDS